MARGVFSALRGMDAFGKTTEDVKVKTRTGAFLTLLSAAIILTFTLIEFLDYQRVQMDTSIIVDKSRGERLTVRMNVTFPHVPCYLLSLDVMDISGEQQRDLSHNILKTRLDNHGQIVHDYSHNNDLKNELDKMVDQKTPGYCGSCYGGLEPESGCCQTCEDVRQSYINRGWSFGNPEAIEQCVREGWTDKIKAQSDEGCNVSGRIRINKVVGSIHMSPGRSFQTMRHSIYELVPYLQDGNKHDFSHNIHQFAFEADDEYNMYKADVGKLMREKLGIKGNPLDNTVGSAYAAEWMFQYFLKVVSTQFRTISGEVVNSHDYSLTHFERDLREGQQGHTQDGVTLTHANAGMPGAFFNFEISPMKVVHTETRQSFAHFLTSTCAIVGGVLTVASIVDSVLFATGRALKKGSGAGSYGGKLM